jgi:hypothetical protein
MVAVSLVLDSMFKTLMADIPRMHRMVEENSYVQNILVQLQHDVDVARSLQQNQDFADPNLIVLQPIVIELTDRTVRYELEAEGIVKRTLEPLLPVPSDPTEPDPNLRRWPINRAVVHWRVWIKDGSGYAVEVQTHEEFNAGGIKKRILANSQVFFLGAFPNTGTKP